MGAVTARWLSVLQSLVSYEDVTIAPDGSAAVVVGRYSDRERDETCSALFLIDLNSEMEPTRLTNGPHDHSPTWSPNGQWIAFVGTDGEPNDHSRLWLLPREGGVPIQLTDGELNAGRGAWSPDGRRIAFTAPVSSTGGEAGHRREPFDWDPIVLTESVYKSDGIGICPGAYKQLFLLTIDSAELYQVTAGPAHARAPLWSRDGLHLAVSIDIAVPGDPGRGQGICLVPAEACGDEPGNSVMVGEAWGLALPVAFCDDDSSLLMLGREAMSEGHSSLFVIAMDGSHLCQIAAQLDRNVLSHETDGGVMLPQLWDGGKSVAFCVRDRGPVQLYGCAIDGTDEPYPLLNGRLSVTSFSASSNGLVLVALANTASSVGETIVLEHHTQRRGGGIRVFHDEVYITERAFCAPDGVTVHGFVLRDPQASTPSPLLLDVHGGPHGSWAPVIDADRSYHYQLLDAGWTILLVNPRGSDGYGEHFYQAVTGDLGQGDGNDLMSAVEALVREGVADRSRLALTGYSYGGYMACWLPTQTNCFAAAVAGGGVSDLVSMIGTADIGGGIAIHEIGSFPWDDWRTYTRSSPMRWASKVTTPTLLLHGEDDQRCPIGQAEEWFNALQLRGVESRFVRYPGASHSFVHKGRPSHRESYALELLSWLRTHVPESGLREGQAPTG